MKNPFNPTFGDVPRLFIGNGEEEKIIELIRESDFARSFFITGVRGSGKTAFLNYVMNVFKEDKNCYALTVINKDDLIDTLCSKLENMVYHFQRKVDSISISGISVKSMNTQMSYEERLEKVLDKVQKQHKYVVIAIDEVTNSKVIQEFAQYFSLLKQSQYPIFVLMTGLPELILNIQNEDRLTFLLRSEKIVMTPLNEAAIAEQYLAVFNCDLRLAQSMAKLVTGYSYAFQLLGWLMFEECQNRVPNEHDLEKIIPFFEMRLFENAYQKIIRGLSEMDIQFLLAMRVDETFQSIVAQMNKDKVYVAQYRKRLIDRQLIKPAGRGKLAFTLPLFDRYLDEIQNPDSLFYLGY